MKIIELRGLGNSDLGGGNIDKGGGTGKRCSKNSQLGQQGSDLDKASRCIQRDGEPLRASIIIKAKYANRLDGQTAE